MVVVIATVLLLIVVLSFFSNKRILPEKWVTGRKIFWLFGAYVFILLVAAVHYIFLLPEAMSSERELSSKEVITASSNLRQKIEDGRFDAIDESYLRNSWLMNPEAEELHINNDPDHLPVYFVQGDYQEVEAVYYQVPSVVNGAAVEAGYHPTIGQKRNVLSVQQDPAIPEDTRYATYKNEFTMQQFDDAETDAATSMDLGFGALVLKIPEQKEIKREGNVENIVKEE